MGVYIIYMSIELYKEVKKKSGFWYRYGFFWRNRRRVLDFFSIFESLEYLVRFLGNKINFLWE